MRPPPCRRATATWPPSPGYRCSGVIRDPWRNCGIGAPCKTDGSCKTDSYGNSRRGTPRSDRNPGRRAPGERACGRTAGTTRTALPHAAQYRPPPHPAAPAPAAQGGWGVPLVVLIVGMFMSVLDISIVNVAIPTMQRDFAATTDEIQWVENGLLAGTGRGRARQRLDGGDGSAPGRVYILSLLGFAAGSALCGLAWDLNSMIVFRVLQAMPGGVLPVVIADDPLPDRPRGPHRGGDGHVRARHHRRAGRRAHAGRLPRGVRRLAADLLHQRAGRHRRHFAAVVVLPRFRPSPLGHFDVLGLPRASPPGCSTLLLALTEGQNWGWTSYTIMILLTVGGARPRAVRRDRARGRQPAAGRARLPLLAVHQLAAAHLGAVGRPVRRAVLHPAATCSSPRASAPSRPACSCCRRRWSWR